MELGLSPAQVADIDLSDIALMRQHARMLRMEQASMVMMAFHAPTELQRLIKESAWEADGVNPVDAGWIEWMESQRRLYGNS